ncbi:hypothetical protein [Flavobacterium macrobrachii]|uniref:hypothetical protein n=1 Tax=Flavobacterium macrobrachii TaxID=591204 RepID=UPI003F6F41A6
MTLFDKIKYLKELLNEPCQNYSDTFKSDIILFFEDDFTINNIQFHFLKKNISKLEIEDWLNNLLSQFVLKFNPEEETENDFISFFL